MELQDAAEAVPRVEPLADRDREVDVLGHFFQRLHVERIDRLLEEQDIEGFDLPPDADDGIRGQLPAHVEHQVHPRAHGLGHRPHPLERQALRLAADGAV